MNSLIPAYTEGTHRLICPEETLAKITPYLLKCGITRCADVTRLDMDFGVPTYCAIRPNALVLQTSNGKGLTPLSAKVSALMESIELYHAENPDSERLRRASANTLSQEETLFVQPEQLEMAPNRFFSENYEMEWVEGEDLIAQKKVWVPASAVYFYEPTLYRTSTNGLASGNHLIEATLHALYELIERDAISKIDVGGNLKIREKCKIIDTMTIDEHHLQHILSRIKQAQSKLVLLWVSSCVPVHTFWAVLLNKTPFSAVSTFNVGYGTHLDINVAANRAITEAIQSRLTLIQASREDIIEKPVYNKDNAQSSPAYIYFNQLDSNASWQDVKGQVKYTEQDLLQSYHYLLSKLSEANYQIIRVDLTKPEFNIPVVKVIVPSFRFKRELF